MELLSKASFWDKIISVVDVIPKIIYFLYTALASGVDALQALVRKLAGLDTYWSSTGNGSNQGTTGQDPLTEFVQGILGFGNSSDVYKALNTVFWSLAIFGLIMLVISTMIAIIKSHYNEDAGGTSPWKYIYTAIKAILTFAIVPVVVTLGMQLSTFALTTLDKIVVGNSDTGAITGIYGTEAVEKLVSDEGGKTYAHYDFFGAQDLTTSTPFSGMLFKAAGYNANRVRTGKHTIESLQGLESIFASDSVLTGDDAQRIEDAAYQVDYAFSNCLMLKNGVSYSDWCNKLQDGARVGLLDIWSVSSIKGFSKWNVSIVWLFYDLWQFNYIVGFAGVAAVFGIMCSIVFGLLTRLIKGAALFLVFPALLGIAPMDNFKAFKGWSSQFIQQILMVFGAVLGINLMMLILPYVQNISFFDPSNIALNVLNAIMDLVMLIVGLQMAKDFINIVNGFVGGADAIGAGDGVKDSTVKSLKQGAKMTLGAGKIGAGALVGVGTATVKAGKGIVNHAKNGDERKANRELKKADKEFNRADKMVDKQRSALASARKEQISAKNSIDVADREYEDAVKYQEFLGGKGRKPAEAKKLGAQYKKDHNLKGISDKQAFEMMKEEAADKVEIAAIKQGVARENYDKAIAKAGSISDKLGKANERVHDARIARSNAIKKAEEKGYTINENQNGIIKSKNSFTQEILGAKVKYKTDENGEFIRDEKGRKIKESGGGGLRGLGSTIGANLGGFGKKLGKEFVDSVSWNSIGKNIVDGMNKTLSEGFKITGIDKLSKDLIDVGKTIRQSTFKPHDAYDGKEGDKLLKELGKQQTKSSEEQLEAIKKTNELLQQFVDANKNKEESK